MAAASPRLKLMTLAGGEKGFVASMVGVEKGLAGVVAPLGGMLNALPCRSWGRRWPDCEPRGWRGARAGMLSWSDGPEGSRKKGRGGDSVCSGEEAGNEAEERDDEEEDMTGRRMQGEGTSYNFCNTRDNGSLRCREDLGRAKSTDKG